MEKIQNKNNLRKYKLTHQNSKYRRTIKFAFQKSKKLKKLINKITSSKEKLFKKILMKMILNIKSLNL